MRPTTASTASAAKGYAAEIFTGAAFVALIVLGAFGLGDRSRPFAAPATADAASRADNLCVRKRLQQQSTLADAQAVCRSRASL